HVTSARCDPPKKRDGPITLDYSPPSILLQPRTLPREPSIVTARVGSKRMPGRAPNPHLSFEPRAGPGPAALKTLGGDSLGFRVREFEQPPAIAASGFQVDRAGAFVADAIARQLGVWGFEVV